jgi:hypothetical protein
VSCCIVGVFDGHGIYGDRAATRCAATLRPTFLNAMANLTGKLVCACVCVCVTEYSGVYVCVCVRVCVCHGVRLCVTEYGGVCVAGSSRSDTAKAEAAFVAATEAMHTAALDFPDSCSGTTAVCAYFGGDDKRM